MSRTLALMRPWQMDEKMTDECLMKNHERCDMDEFEHCGRVHGLEGGEAAARQVPPEDRSFGETYVEQWLIWMAEVRLNEPQKVKRRLQLHPQFQGRLVQVVFY